MKKQIKIDAQEYRIVAISDVHARPDLLKKLIDKVELKESDYLIIIGDFINKGENSFECLKLVRELGKRERTIILKGNHELFIAEAMKELHKAKRLLDFLKKNYYKTLIHDFAENSNISLQDISGQEFYELINTNYSKEMKYIDELPIMCEFDDYIFVHGGHDETFDISNDERKFLKYDNFREISGVNKKNIVVGHWPVSNTRDDHLSNSIQFDFEKNIIMIDGGVGVKSTGELNAFIVEKENDKTVSKSIFVNDFTKKQITKSMIHGLSSSFVVNYPDFDIDLIEKGSEVSLCRHSESGEVIKVINEAITETMGEYEVNMIYPTRFFDLEVGEEVFLVNQVGKYLLVKYENTFGWIKAEQV